MATTIDLLLIGNSLAFAEIRSEALKHPLRFINLPLLQSLNNFPFKSIPSTKDSYSPSIIVPLSVYPRGLFHAEFLPVIRDLEDALLQEIQPELCTEGVNGTYFFKDSRHNNRAVFKPTDEEGLSPSNPKNSSSSDSWFQLGIPQNGASIREVAAYLLDQLYGGFAGVPHTEMVKIPSSHLLSGGTDCEDFKEGSLQVFIESDGSASEVGPSLFPIRQVHKIGILDVVILNSDRHEGNLLFKQENGTYELFPIDHGYSLPTCLGKAWFEWLNWPQAKQPFDEEHLSLIANIDTQANSLLLRNLGIQEESILMAKISTTLLKKCAANGMNLYQIGSLVSRLDPEQPSPLEEIYNQSIDSVSGELDFVSLERMIDEVILKKSERK